MVRLALSASQLEIEVDSRSKLVDVDCVFGGLVNVGYVGSACHEPIVGPLRQRGATHVLVGSLLVLQLRSGDGGGWGPDLLSSAVLARSVLLPTINALNFVFKDHL